MLEKEKIPKISVEELRELLLAEYKIGQSIAQKLQERIQRRSDQPMPVQAEDPRSAIVKDKIIGSLYEMTARRLKRNRREVPLFSKRDIVKLIPQIIGSIEQMSGEKFGTRESVKLKSLFKTILCNLFDIASDGSFLPGGVAYVAGKTDQYEAYWRRIRTILALARERNIKPVECLTDQDEITRRLYSKEEYNALFQKVMSKSFDPEILKKAFFQPIIGMFADSPEELKKIERDFEAELMPQIAGYVKAAKQEVDSFISEAIARIYDRK